MPALVSPIPSPVGDMGSTDLPMYINTDFSYSYALGGIPFLSAADDQRPYMERMAEIRKQQFDNFAEPGEQSLEGWWLRSQSTFTGGAGVLYQDPDNDNQFNYRFADSLGIDPWTSGNVQLLRRSAKSITSTNNNLMTFGYVDPLGVDSAWVANGNNLSKLTDSGVTSIVTATAIASLTGTGSTYIFARTADGVWSGVDTAAPTQRYTGALAAPQVAFVKDRLIITTSNAVHQGVLTAAAAALPAAIYTHQDPNWRWRSITDGPAAIYIAGDSGTTSQIHKFAVVDEAGLPVLRWAGVTATMPAGETIRTIYSYVGTFVGIATSKGFRVGEIDSNGDIVYGPLLFEPEFGCRGIVGNDRFMWVGSQGAHDGDTGLFRVDLGNQIQEQTTRAVRYAYARDIYGEGEFSGGVNSVTMLGASDRKVFAVNFGGFYKEQATELLPLGYLTTGRIRFNTEEPKLYKFFSVRTPASLNGDLSVAILSEGGGEIPMITYSPLSTAGTKDVAISQPQGPQNWMRLKFIFERGSDTSFGAQLNGWQVKALPGSIRQRIITVPVLLFNKEEDGGGNRIGYPGYARERFEAFKAVARAGDVILFQELTEGFTTQVVIEDWEFQQDTAPFADGGALGGYLTVRMRTVAENT